MHGRRNAHLLWLFRRPAVSESGSLPAAPFAPAKRIGGLDLPAGRRLARRIRGSPALPPESGTASPAFKKTRYSRSTFATSTRPTTRRASPVAKLGSSYAELPRPVLVRAAVHRVSVITPDA